jgi:2-keto-3-deoxy-L-rhamnonate aldolase RhmA
MHTLLHHCTALHTAEQVTVMSSFSQPALMQLLQAAAAYDLICIDGDHASAAVLTDALLAWQSLK